MTVECCECNRTLLLIPTFFSFDSTLSCHIAVLTVSLDSRQPRNACERSCNCLTILTRFHQGIVDCILALHWNYCWTELLLLSFRWISESCSVHWWCRLEPQAQRDRSRLSLERSRATDSLSCKTQVQTQRLDEYFDLGRLKGKINERSDRSEI